MINLSPSQSIAMVLRWIATNDKPTYYSMPFLHSLMIGKPGLTEHQLASRSLMDG